MSITPPLPAIHPRETPSVNPLAITAFTRFTFSRFVCFVAVFLWVGVTGSVLRLTSRELVYRSTGELCDSRTRHSRSQTAAIVVHQIITDFAMIEYIRSRTELVYIARCVKSAQDLAFCRITSHVQQLDFVDAREAAVVGELAHHALLFV